MKIKKISPRFGIGELYGLGFASLTPKQIRELTSANNADVRCPFKSREAGNASLSCSKAGGVCSLLSFVRNENGKVNCEGSPVTTCPQRFFENGMIFRWVGELLLGTQRPVVIPEVPFLMSFDKGEKGKRPVGKIDSILVGITEPRLTWCALEIQAVYFSGDEMEADFDPMRTWQGPGIPFPSGRRRPDFRSSGPKRLMPQLQTKVPTISRWGKKTAVVVDSEFWADLAGMREMDDLSNSEIIWFVVSYSQSTDGRFSLQKDSVHFTTLDHAVERLTGGTPMSLENFENEIRARIPHP